MIYGLYLSATGVLANSYRQDVIANNLANAETVGFKRDLAVFQEQRTEARLRGLSPAMYSNRVLEGIGGGIKVQMVLDDKGSPIKLPPGGVSSIERDGAVNQNGQVVARVGLFDVPQDAKLTKRGDAMFAYAQTKPLRPADGVLRSGFVERSNAEPTNELTALLDAQRQLEANANLIRYQDQTLGRLVNDVGKIG
ncbi:MAG: flagellar basal body protein [Planctomycetota bacterium]|nr:flagellar basal body protein [Planctomycetota bacterium]